MDILNGFKYFFGKFDLMSSDIFLELINSGGSDDVGGHKTAVVDKSEGEVGEGKSRFFCQLGISFGGFEGFFTAVSFHSGEKV